MRGRMEMNLCGRRARPRLALAILILGLQLAGCGGGHADDPFALCGNGRLDPGEQCDDGNLSDNDDCLSTCVLASCNDPFGTCNGSDLHGNTCASFSRVDVTGLSCKQNCRLDFSGCGATFTPTPAATATATPTAPPPPPCGNGLLDRGERCAGGGASCTDPGVLQDAPCCPDAGALSSGEYCTVCAEDCTAPTPAAVTPGPTVSVSLAPPEGQTVTAITVLIGYRTALVSLPGSGVAGSVGSRIKNKPTSTTLAYNDFDYALRVQLSRTGGFAVGKLFTINFDAIEDTPVPTVTDFSCTVEVCQNDSEDIPGCTCAVGLSGVPATATPTPQA